MKSFIRSVILKAEQVNDINININKKKISQAKNKVK